MNGQRLEDVPVEHCRVVTPHDESRQYVRFAGVHTVRAPGHVYRHMRQRLVHRHPRVTESPDAGLVSQRLMQRLTENDGNVLDGVVCVHLDVASCAHEQVECRVLAQGSEHVVEERDAGVHLGRPGAVEV
jgi:hypothetical protein